MTRDYASLQRKPFLTPIWLSFLIAVIAFGLLSFAGWAAWVWATADSTIIIVVRHAEKSEGSDPPLAAAGEARAQLLSRMFGDARSPDRIDAIYVSAAQRDRMTAAPLAMRLGITPVVSADDPRALARRVMSEHEGGRILIVGHGDTVPSIVSALSGGPNKESMMAEMDYGTMYVVAVPRIGRVNVLRATY